MLLKSLVIDTLPQCLNTIILPQKLEIEFSQSGGSANDCILLANEMA